MFMHSAFCYNSAFKLWEAGPRSAETKSDEEDGSCPRFQDGHPHKSTR